MREVETALSDAGHVRVEDGSRRAAAAFSARADALGLVDVAYDTVDSPLGRLVVASTPRGLVRVAYADDSADSMLADLGRRISVRILDLPGRLAAVKKQLEEYFGGRRAAFDVPLDLRLCTDFGRGVLSVATAIPYGEVSTYGDVAARAGHGGAARAAGNALGANPIPIIVPCHRVVRTSGVLGGYVGGLERKQWLIGLEARRRDR